MFRVSTYSVAAVSVAIATALLAGLVLDSEKTEDLRDVSSVSMPSSDDSGVPPRVVSASFTSAPENLSSETVVLDPGDTLINVLRKFGISQAESFSASETLSGVFDPRDLKAGQKLSIMVRSDSEALDTRHLDRLSFISETDTQVVVEHENGGIFAAWAEPIDHDVRLTRSIGTITNNFFKSTREAGVPTSVALQAYQALGQTIDFQRSLTEGDRFSLGYEINVDEKGAGTHAGNLVFISLDISESSLVYFRHETSDGYASYFDEDGNSIESGFMKTPVAGGRLSSPYGERDHPVLGFTRMHKGLDFAAERGTPVLAVGDGTVVQRRRNGSYGNYILIRHTGGISSAYAHLDRYEDALASGDRVRRGEVIGYVGETGLTTGPNLHFEILSGGRQVNPAKVSAPLRQRLEGEALVRFQREAAEIRERLEISTTSENALVKPEPTTLPSGRS